MSDQYNYQIDIRFAVFIIWAILFLILIVFPISIIFFDHLLQKVFSLSGCTCWGCCDREDENEAIASRVRGIHYAFLSSEQKLEIKRLRRELLKRCLQSFSVWLMKQHMILLKEKINENVESERNDHTTSDETKVVRSAREYECQTYDQEDEETAQYTYISVPFPGYDRHGIHASTLLYTNNKKKDQSKVKNRISFANKLLRKKTKSKTSEESYPEQQPPSNITVQLSEKRSASKFCAICLGSYEPYDEISWSSNDGCTHVFHTDCILTWLYTIGDKWSRNQWFTENLESDELLRYSLECPCCRQDFVCNTVVCAYCEDDAEDDQMIAAHQSTLSNVSEHSV
jgi:hypothetical protein